MKLPANSTVLTQPNCTAARVWACARPRAPGHAAAASAAPAAPPIPRRKNARRSIIFPRAQRSIMLTPLGDVARARYAPYYGTARGARSLSLRRVGRMRRASPLTPVHAAATCVLCTRRSGWTDLMPLITGVMEDYLKAIYKLQRGHGSVATVELSKELRVAAATTTAMVQRLAKLKLVSYHRYRGLTLTSAGERIALETIRHHRLIELYLAQHLGVDLDKVHGEAEKMEHVLSHDVEARIAAALGNPTTDPHGDPIPSTTGTMRDIRYRPDGVRSRHDGRGGACQRPRPGHLAPPRRPGNPPGRQGKDNGAASERMPRRNRWTPGDGAAGALRRRVHPVGIRRAASDAYRVSVGTLMVYSFVCHRDLTRPTSPTPPYKLGG